MKRDRMRPGDLVGKDWEGGYRTTAVVVGCHAAQNPNEVVNTVLSKDWLWPGKWSVEQRFVVAREPCELWGPGTWRKAGFGPALGSGEKGPERCA